MSEQISIHENGTVPAGDLHNLPLNGRVYNPTSEPNPDKINMRSEAFQEVFSRKPRFFERWALLLFLLILSFVFASTWFISYPDIIQGSATLTAANAPKEIVPRIDGKLVRLFVHNDDTVDQNSMIAWLESTGDHKNVILLNRLLDSGISLLQQNKTEKVSALFKKTFTNLGELQTPYQLFITAWQQFTDYLINGYYYKRKEVLEQDLSFLKKMHVVTEEQQAFTQQDVQLSQEALDVNNSLYNDKVISKQDLRDQKSKLVAKQLALPQIRSILLTNENGQTDKQRDIDELDHSIEQQKTIFLQAIQTLKSLSDDWIKKYTIKSPIDGKVVFLIPLQENQFIQADKILGYVNPGDSRYYAQVSLPQENFGKVAVGQKVQLRFDAYPSQEFGFVPGRLSYISKVASDSVFLANVELPRSLVTNYKRQIQYRSGLTAQAMIVTKEARLLQRFWYTIRKGIQR